MQFQSCTEAEISRMINSGIPDLSGSASRFFEAVRIAPEKWVLDPWGKSTNGFWVIAIIGRKVCWFNEIEDGFNTSFYSEYGVIDEYWCDQDDFDLAVRKMKSAVETGAPHVKCGPPRELD